MQRGEIAAVRGAEVVLVRRVVAAVAAVRGEVVAMPAPRPIPLLP